MSIYNIEYIDMYNKCIDILSKDDDVFIESLELLDGINECLEGQKVFEMDEIDDFFFKTRPYRIISLICDDFDLNDNYFYEDEDGIHSIDSKIEFYRDMYNTDEVLQMLIDDFDDVCFGKYRFIEDFEIALTELCTYEM